MLCRSAVRICSLTAVELVKHLVRGELQSYGQQVGEVAQRGLVGQALAG